MVWLRNVVARTLTFEQQLDELLGKVHRQDQELRQTQQESAKDKVPQDRQVPKRQKLPDHLPRVERIHEIPEEERVCLECDQVCQKIGEETSELLGRLTINFVIRDVRIKYGCPRCHEGVQVAPLPARVVDGGKFDRTILADIVAAKFKDYLPLYRQSERFGREGLDISRSTLCDQVVRVAELLQPIAEQVQVETLAKPVIQTDDTHARMATKGQPRGKNSKKTYFWPYRAGPGLTFFDWTESRSREGPLRVLGNYTGYVQVDGYAGYDELFALGKATRVGCMAHARRKFHQALDTHHDKAMIALGFIKRLYEIENEARTGGLAPSARKALRDQKARPVMEGFKNWLELHSDLHLPKSPLGKAIGYALSQWTFLERYLEDGRLEIDNNLVENDVRPIALGRKNWLMLGGEEAGRHAATLMTLAACCRSLNVNYQLYLWDVLARIDTCPAGQIHDLTPLGWQAKFQAEAEANFRALEREVMKAVSSRA